MTIQENREDMPITYGYIRVSSRDQNEERQLIALNEFKVPPENIYFDKLSGKDFNRPGYMKVRRMLRKGDLLVVQSIDRLGRNYTEILEEWRYITKQAEANIKVLDMPILDTRGENDSTGTLISDIVLRLLSYVAETERDNIRQRQAEGIAAAKARGVQFGRPKNQLPRNFAKIYDNYANKRLSSRQCADKLKISQSTFICWCKRYASGEYT